MIRPACVALLLAPLPVQGKRTTEAAFEKLKSVVAAQMARQVEALQKFQQEEDQAGRDRWHAVAREAEARITEAKAEFRRVFAKSNWHAFKLPADALILETGLDLVARHALVEDPRLAIRSWELLLRKLPASGAASYARATGLPIAWLGAGRFREAVQRIPQLLAQVADREQHMLRLRLADAHAALGEIDRALAILEEAHSRLRAVSGPAHDPLVRARQRIELRLDLLGRQAPPIESDVWLGAAARPFAEVAGRVVLLDFFATWCGPCRQALPEIEWLHRKLAKRGLVVLGVTHPYPNGFLPSSADDLQAGKRVDGMDRQAWLAHLADFRKVARPSYPFVVGSPQDFVHYEVNLIPSLVVIGKDGRIRFAATGEGQHRILHRVIDRCLAERRP